MKSNEKEILENNYYYFFLCPLIMSWQRIWFIILKNADGKDPDEN